MSTKKDEAVIKVNPAINIMELVRNTGTTLGKFQYSYGFSRNTGTFSRNTGTFSRNTGTFLGIPELFILIMSQNKLF